MTLLTKRYAALALSLCLAACGTEDDGELNSGSLDDTESVEQREDGEADVLYAVQPGQGGVVNETIVVGKGQTWNGGNKRYTAGKSLGDGSQKEGQKPIFKLEDGAKLINVVIGKPAADGVHTYGNATLQNIHWEDIGEDAMTIKKSGTVILNGGSAKNGDDKVFQINAASTFKVSNFKAENAGKFIRQNGDTTFKVEVFIDNCEIKNMKESIFRTDSKSSTVHMTNTRYSGIGKEPFLVPNKSQVRESNNKKM
jgi:pectate lyase C